MNSWLIILFNLLILTTWVYLLYQVFTIDPEVQAEWQGNLPTWADNYKNMILSIKITAFINGIIVLLTILTTVYKMNTDVVVGGSKRR